MGGSDAKTKRSAGVFLAGLFLLASAYYFSGRLALNFFASLNASASPVWPPTGIAIAGLLLLGLRAWPAILVGAFAFNFATSGHLPSSLAIAIGNTLEGLVGAVLAQRCAKGAAAFRSVPDTIRFATLSALVAPLISATVGVASLVVWGLAPSFLFWPIWLTWWLGDAGGALLLAPVILLWAQGPGRLKRVGETVAMLAVVAASAGLAVTNVLSSGRLAILALVTVPLLLWPALRLGPRATATALLIVATIAVAGTFAGTSPFPQPTSNDELLLLQVFLLVLAIATLTMAATQAQWGPSKARKGLGLSQSTAWMAITLVPLVAGTVVAGTLTADLTGQLASDRFDSHADEVAAQFQERLDEQVGRLRDLRAFITASDNVTRTEFDTYVQASGWLRTNPGVQGVQLITLVPAGQSAAFEMQRRADADLPAELRATYSIHPAPTGDAWVVDYIYPLAGNEPALGLDLAFEAARRQTIEAALSTGEAAASPAVALLQGPERVGLLLMMPVEEDNTSHIVDTAHFVDDLARAALDGTGAAVTLFDGPPEANGGFGDRTPLYGDASTPQPGPDSRQRAIEVGGRTWTLVVGQPVGLLTPVESYASWLVLGGAGILSFFLCTLVYSTANTGRRATQLAETMSAEARLGQRRLEGAQTAGHIGSWEWDIPANQITWTDELYRLYGLRPQEFPATFQAFQDRLHPEDRDMVIGHVMKAMQDHQDFAFDHRLVRPDGQVRWLSGRGHVMVEDGKPMRMLGTAIDITDRKEAEAMLEEGRRQLAVAEKLSALGTLVAGVGHEIRTPLTYIMTRMALVDLKLKAAAAAEPHLEPLSKDVQTQTESAKQGVWRIDRIVQQLRGFSKAQLNAAPAELAEVVNQAADLFRAAHKGQCDVHVALGVGLPAMTVDRGQVQQVLINLFNNAAEAMPQGGTIEVRTRADGPDHVLLEVEDRGAGIPPEVQGRLFDPFFTTKKEGTGLGLSVSRRIVEAHGGTLTFSTQVGKGTRFHIRLPAHGDLPPTPPLPEGARP